MALRPIYAVPQRRRSTQFPGVSRIVTWLPPTQAAFPSGLDRTATRALGDPAVTSTGGGVAQVYGRGLTQGVSRAVLFEQRSPQTRIVSQPIGGLSPTQNLFPAGLDRSATRALGSPAVTSVSATVAQIYGRGLTQGVSRAVLFEPRRRTEPARFITVTIAPVTLAPTGLTHTRAQGAPAVNPAVLPAGQARTRALGTITVTTGTQVSPASITHTRAQGSPTVNPQLLPAALAHTRALGATYIAPSPTGLVHTRALGAPHVNPQALPAALAHARAQGSPAVNPQAKPAGLAHTRAQGSLTVTAGFLASPASLAHTRAQGAPTVNPQVRPAGQSHTRTLGAPTAGTPSVRQLGTLVVTVAWVPRPTGLEHARALGDPTTHGHATVSPASLVRDTRLQGAPQLSARTAPASLTHTRTLGAASVNPRTLTPTGLSHTRGQGAAAITIAWIARPDSLTRTRAQGSPVARGFQEVGPPSLTRTRAQGTPVLSGRALPASLTHSRVQGAPAVNVRTLAPLAISRA